ncbi:MAG: hypothetical protein Pg6C_10600 [Treponemataceae bacterium]|jgi:hypothetical protein|nr:MAG: hypothetical protein Pg6C_10600 [Treponemataceae bacterium]
MVTVTHERYWEKYGHERGKKKGDGVDKAERLLAVAKASAGDME